MADRSTFNKAKHIQYWKRCLRSHLPTAYTQNDSNRMTLAFFIVSALDLLGVLFTEISQAERDDCIAWIYRCQHPEGGFRGFPATDFGALRNEENKVWDPANVPATYFALAALAVLGDDMGRVRRRACLAWLRRMQRGDGSFGEHVGEKGKIEGGTDTRFGYCATGVRWILRGTVEGSVDGVEDIRVDELVQCIRCSQTYDGGISEAPYHEAHAGFTYCAIAALSFLSRLPSDQSCSQSTSLANHMASSNPVTATTKPANARSTHTISPSTGLTNLPLTLHWLLARQTATIDEDDAFDTECDETDTAATCHDAHSFVKMQSFPSQNGEASFKHRPRSHFELDWLGFNGRSNKIADTCYAFWVSASLDILNKAHFLAINSSRRYLLDKTQHQIGGFGKLPGDPPDMYHSYLGLAALAVLQSQEPKEKVLKDFMPALCFSREACERLDALAWRRRITGGRGAGETEEQSHREEEERKPMAQESANTSFSSSQGSDSTEASKGSKASVFGNMVYGY